MFGASKEFIGLDVEDDLMYEMIMNVFYDEEEEMDMRKRFR